MTSRRDESMEREGLPYLSPPRAGASARRVDGVVDGATARLGAGADDFRRPAPASLPPRRPQQGSVGDGLKGFQFPLSQSAGNEMGPAVVPGSSLGGGGPIGTNIKGGPSRPSAPPIMRMQSAQPGLGGLNSKFTFGAGSSAKPTGPPAASSSPAAPLAPRPAFLRQASVAVMENRSHTQAQANNAVQKELQNLASVGEDARAIAMELGGSMDAMRGSGLALPPPPIGRFDRAGTGMGRSRSGSRLDDAPPLRELIKVSAVTGHVITNVHGMLGQLAEGLAADEVGADIAYFGSWAVPACRILANGADQYQRIDHGPSRPSTPITYQHGSASLPRHFIPSRHPLEHRRTVHLSSQRYAHFAVA